MSRPHRTYHEQLDDVREQLRHGRGPTPRAKHADAGSRSTKGAPSQPAASATDAFARVIHSLEHGAANTRRVHAEGAAQRTQGKHDTFAHGYHQAETPEVPGSHPYWPARATADTRAGAVAWYGAICGTSAGSAVPRSPGS